MYFYLLLHTLYKSIPLSHAFHIISEISIAFSFIYLFNYLPLNQWEFCFKNIKFDLVLIFFKEYFNS